ncbi:MAG: pyruvate kinase alpha/beta domain-containing protein [Candidatus Bathyarchaeia archaeon]
MGYISSKTIYFERPGPINTEKTLELAKIRAKELKIKHVIISSISGDSVFRAIKLFKNSGIQIICVTNPPRYYKISDLKRWITYSEIPELSKTIEDLERKGVVEVHASIPEKIAEELGKLGVRVIRGASPFQGADFSLKLALGGITIGEVIILSLRLLSPGLAVAVESTIKAADDGAIPIDKEVISTGGTEKGLDTAIVIKPSISLKVFDEIEGLEIREIICKPRTITGISGKLLERKT